MIKATGDNNQPSKQNQQKNDSQKQNKINMQKQMNKNNVQKQKTSPVVNNQQPNDSDKLKAFTDKNKSSRTPLDFIEYIKNKFFSTAKKPYYFVPPCPNCGSFMTGRFFTEKKDEYNNDWVIREGLKNGEIMAPIPKIENENVFCLECNYGWHYDVTSSWFSIEEIELQKDMRHTRNILKDMNMEKAEETKGKKNNDFTHGVKKYVGHL